VGARLLAPEADEVPPFPLEQTVAALAADPPHWPASTTDLRRVRLVLRFSSAGLLRLLGGTAELTVELLDYPGEWLLDLPLLQQSYGDWSRATFALARRGVRAPLARDWLDFLARHPADRTGDPQTALQAYELYRDFLAACRDREQLSLLQPGRFLNPGQIADPSLLQFCPMPLAIGARAPPGSLAALTALNEDLRGEYIRDCQNGVARWNRILDSYGVGRSLHLPHAGFNRKVGLFAGHHIGPSGELLAEAEWRRRAPAWLPTEQDKAYVRSLMKPVYERGKIAAWIAPPRQGINGKPFEYEYVHLS